MLRTKLSARLVVTALLAAVLALVAPWASAQPRPSAPEPSASAAAGGAGGTAPEVEVAPDSPRAAVRQFVELCKAGELQEASRFLDVPPNRAGDAAGLTRKLKSVLDRHVLGSGDLSTLASPYSSGNTADKLPPGVDELGKVPGPNGPEPVRLIRHGGVNGPVWVFSRNTVDRIDVWYARLKERWLFDHLPEPLLRTGPFDILYWQFVVLPVLILLAWGVGRLLAFLTRKAISKLLARRDSKWDDVLLRKIVAPLTLAWGLGVFAIVVPRLGFYDPAEETVEKVIHAGLLVAFFWSLLRTIDVTKAYMLEVTVPTRTSARSIIPLGSQLVKLVVLAGAVVTVLSEFGYPVTSLIAGLGLGGVVLALAAQKTVENLFGSVSISLDQPFKVGDLVKVEDAFGNVEAVGLRSTRIRTLDRTLVTIPNGKLADMRIESYAARDRFRLHVILGVLYSTTVSQMRSLVKDLEAAVEEQPSLFKENRIIAVMGFGPSSIDIEVSVWFEVPTWADFLPVRQEVLLRFMEAVEKNGTEFAFPTRTVHLVKPLDATAGPQTSPDVEE